ncbi:MAG: cytochrome d ubiquinol oxidase subunit II [Syntrophaceae bacterium]
MNTLQALQITWFALWAVLWAVYFMLDGFVLGTAMLQPFLAKNENERLATVEIVGPVWNGNEVWLITAGGATFAAFATTYALMFSYLYTALLLLLFSLIIRGVSLEFRGKVAVPGWKKIWDLGFQVSSLLIALLLGVAFGNIFEGLPMDAAGYHGNLLTLLNPYGLVTGVLFVALFVVHGAIYTGIKTSGAISERALALAGKAWLVLLAVAVIFLAHTALVTRLYENYISAPVFLVVPLAAVAALVLIKLFLVRSQALKAFAASCVTIVMVAFTGIVGLFPNLIPSSIDTTYSLTIYNSSSSRLTLTIMTVVALIFVPIVIVYKIWVYRLFRDKISPEALSGEKAY